MTNSVPRPAASILRKLSNERCAHCGAALDVLQVARGGICASPVCQRKKVVAFLRRQEGERKEEVRQTVEAFRARVATALGPAAPAALMVVTVPALRRRALRLSRSRRRMFRAHLTQIVRQAFEEPSHPSGDSAVADDMLESCPPPAHPYDAMACASCRGHCCRIGGTRAFLDVSVIRRFISLHPGLPAREVVRAYMKRLPDPAIADSCVYHGPRGCSLPRDMRSGICNRYFCDGLKSFHASPGDADASPVLIVAVEGRQVRRSTLIEPGGKRARIPAGIRPSD